jgi:uncharacterized phage-associated protein
MTVKNNFSALENCIIYLVDNLQGELTRTKLVKLLFLADLNYYRQKGGSLTEVTYYSYFYGPFSEKIMEAINNLNGFEIEEHCGINPEGKEYYTYAIGKNPRCSEIELVPEGKDVLDSIINQFGYMPLNDLLDYVYKSEPYRKCKKGDVIDLD